MDAYQTSLHILGRRSCSEQALRKKLREKAFSNSNIDEALAKLTVRGYLNDAALCQRLYEGYCSTGKYGLRNIIGKLKTNGIPDSIIQDAIRHYGDEDECKAAIAALTKKFHRVDKNSQGKMFRFLSYRGFSAYAIRKAIELYYLEAVDD